MANSATDLCYHLFYLLVFFLACFATRYCVFCVSRKVKVPGIWLLPNIHRLGKFRSWAKPKKIFWPLWATAPLTPAERFKHNIKSAVSKKNI